MGIKPYDLALVVGRFQPFHNGHYNNILTAKTLADRVLVLIGSAQESGTERNPFDYATREKLIKDVFGDEVIIRPLNDLTNENDIGAHWGAYLLDQVKFHMGKIPEIMVYGDEDCVGWFGKDDLRFIRVVMSRSFIPYSSTKDRELLLRNDEEEWLKWHNQHNHKDFSELHTKLMRVPYYKKRFDELIKQPLKPWSDKGI
jgi:cytidyltransferase-like protein